MKYTQEKLGPIKIIGIAARVTPATASEKISALWQQWFREGLEAKIPNRLSSEIYNIYTNYEGDHTKPYTCFLGCRVESIDRIPDRMQAIEIVAGDYAVFDVQGKLPDVVVETWQKIYGMKNFVRRFAADFDVYGAEASNPDNARLKTFVSIKWNGY